MCCNKIFGMKSFPAVWIIVFFGMQVSVQDVHTQDAFFSLNPFLELYTPLPTENSDCLAEALYFKASAKVLAPWALQMLDASSKIAPSFLTGNLLDLGNFDQCLSVNSDEAMDQSRHIIGKYCLVKATLNQTAQSVGLGNLAKERTWSVCMPSKCTQADLIQHLQISLKDVASNIQAVHCESSLDYPGLSVGSWMMIIFTLCLVTFVLAVTWIDYRSVEISNQLTKSILLSFSLLKNGKMLMGTAPPGLMLDSLQGIRVLSVLAIIAFHRALRSHAIEPDLNHTSAFKILSQNLVGMLMLRGGIVVDCFFLVSGIVIAYGFMRERKAQVPFSYFKHVVYRYLRITPPYLFVILMHMTILYEFGSGPLWDANMGADMRTCTERWWTNILYINNYVDCLPGVACLDHTWYLAADMHFYLMAPAFLFILYKKQKLGIILVAVTCLASCIYTFVITYDKRYPYVYDSNTPNNDLGSGHFQYVHVRSETRIPSYLIGLLLGYYLDYFGNEKLKMYRSSRILGWTLSTLLLITVVYLEYLLHWIGTGPFLRSLYECTHRPLFGAAIGWIIFACDQGSGGFVNKFLSHRYFQILSRLSFCFYLIHYIAINYDFGTTRTAGYFTYHSMFQKLVFDIVVVTFGSAVLSLVMEYPFIHLNKLIFKKSKKV